MVGVIFIDLEGSSREPARRAALQSQLSDLRDHLNEAFMDRLSVRFQVVWGDELKGVLIDPAAVWDVYRTAYRFMNGTRYYFAAGLGTIDTPYDGKGNDDINLLDGTAFKAAREAMDQLKADDPKPYPVRFGAPGDVRCREALNAYVAVMNDLVQHMTPAQRRHFLREFPWNGNAGGPVEPEVSRQAVWETLQRARIDAYRAANRGLEVLLGLVRDHPDLILPKGEERS